MANLNSASVFGMELVPRAIFGEGRYTLLRQLGRSENSEVWLAHDVPGARRVALKFLPEALVSDYGTLRRLTEQVRRNVFLNHTHIAATFELVHDLRTTAIATQYIDGWSLASLMLDRPQRRFQVEEIEWWVRQLCAALQYAHGEFDLCHGDLNPANLVQDSLDELKVTDFGLAGCLRKEGAAGGPAKKISGRLGLLSPQQAGGAPPGRLDDIYSLGATLFNLLTGTPPFYKGEILKQITGLEAPTMAARLQELGHKDASVPAVWETTVAACLAKEPGKRPQSVIEVQQLLDKVELAEPNSPARILRRGYLRPTVDR